MKKVFIACALTIVFGARAYADICQEAILPPKEAYPSQNNENNSSFNFRDQSISPSMTYEALFNMELLCWKFDGKSGQVTGPKGEILKFRDYYAFFNKYDPSKAPLNQMETAVLERQNCRIEENQVKCRHEGDGTVEAMSYLEILVYLQEYQLGTSQSLMNRLQVAVSKMDPNHPLDEADLKEFIAINKSWTGEETLPRAVADAFQIGQKIGKINEALNKNVDQLNRLFDGIVQRSSYVEMNGFTQIHSGEWRAKADQAYFNQTERVVGELGQKMILKVFSENLPDGTENLIGKQILAHLADENGTIRVPALKIGTVPGKLFESTYQEGRNTIVLDRQRVIETVLSLLPESKRFHYEESFRDGPYINRFLLGHPDIMEALVHRWDLEFARDLTYAWQDRRIPLGPYADGDLIESEYEAYGWQNRYLFGNMQHDPKSLGNKDSRSQLQRLVDMLADFDNFRGKIARDFVERENTSDLDFQTALEMLEKRRESRERHGITTPVQLLERIGLLKSEEAVKEFRSRYDQQAKNFLGKEYPEMQKQAKELFPRVAADLLSNTSPANPDESADQLRAALLLARSAKTLGAGGDALVNGITATAQARGSDLFRKAGQVVLRHPGAGGILDDYFDGKRKLNDSQMYMEISGESPSKANLVSSAGDLSKQFYRLAETTTDPAAKLDGYLKAGMYLDYIRQAGRKSIGDNQGVQDAGKKAQEIALSAENYMRALLSRIESGKELDRKDEFLKLISIAAQEFQSWTHEKEARRRWQALMDKAAVFPKG